MLVDMYVEDNDIYVIHALLFYTLNPLISIICLCSMPYMLKQITMHSGQNITLLKVVFNFDLLYLAIVVFTYMFTIIRGVLLYAVVFLYYAYEPFYDDWYYSPALSSGCAVLEIIVIAIWISTKSLPSTSKLHHTFAFSQIFLFIHFVGCNLMVAVPFIAVSPAQTLAAIVLFYSVLVGTILYIYYMMMLDRGICFCCQMLVAFVFFCGMIQFLTLLVLYFNELVQNGLTFSGLGSLLLSFTLPFLVVFLTLKFQSLSDDARNKDNRNVNNDLTENTPLIINNF